MLDRSKLSTEPLGADALGSFGDEWEERQSGILEPGVYPLVISKFHDERCRPYEIDGVQYLDFVFDTAVGGAHPRAGMYGPGYVQVTTRPFKRGSKLISTAADLLHCCHPPITKRPRSNVDWLDIFTQIHKMAVPFTVKLEWEAIDTLLRNIVLSEEAMKAGYEGQGESWWLAATEVEREQEYKSVAAFVKNAEDSYKFWNKANKAARIASAARQFPKAEDGSAIPQITSPRTQELIPAYIYLQKFVRTADEEIAETAEEAISIL